MLIVLKELDPKKKHEFLSGPARALGTSVFVAFVKSHLVRRWSSETHNGKFRARKRRQIQSQNSCLFVIKIIVTKLLVGVGVVSRYV